MFPRSISELKTVIGIDNLSKLWSGYKRATLTNWLKCNITLFLRLIRSPQLSTTWPNKDLIGTRLLIAYTATRQSDSISTHPLPVTAITPAYCFLDFHYLCPFCRIQSPIYILESLPVLVTSYISIQQQLLLGLHSSAFHLTFATNHNPGIE